MRNLTSLQFNTDVQINIFALKMPEIYFKMYQDKNVYADRNNNNHI